MPFAEKDNSALVESQQVQYLTADNKKKRFFLYQKGTTNKDVGNTLVGFVLKGIRTEIAESAMDQWHVVAFDLQDGEDLYELKLSRDSFSSYLTLKQLAGIAPGEKVDWAYHEKGMALAQDGRRVPYHPSTMSAPFPVKDEMGTWSWDEHVVQWIIETINGMNSKLGNQYPEVKDKPLGNNYASQLSSQAGGQTVRQDPVAEQPGTALPGHVDEDDLPF